MKEWVLDGLLEFTKLSAFVVVLSMITLLFIKAAAAIGIDVGYGYLAFYAMVMLSLTMVASKLKYDANKRFDQINKEKK